LLEWPSYPKACPIQKFLRLLRHVEGPFSVLAASCELSRWNLLASWLGFNELSHAELRLLEEAEMTAYHG